VVPMPHMGVSIDEGTVTVWHVAVGDDVVEGQVLCEIATDKVDMEVESPAAGTVTAIFAEADAVVPVGEAICELDGDGSGGGASVAPEGGASTATGEGSPGAFGGVPGDPSPASAPGSSAPAAGVAERAAGGRDANGSFDPVAAADAVTSLQKDGPLASPIAKRIASKRGVDLNLVTGTGKRGRIRKADVLAAAEAGPSPTVASPAVPTAAPPLGIPAGYEAVPHEIVPTSRVRQAIAEHMIRSRQTAAHMTTEVDVDLSAVIRARTELNKARLTSGEAKLSFLPFIARAACASLSEYPDMNATFQGTQTIRWGQVNLGIAVDTEAGLLVPVIPDAGSLTAPAIGAAIADLAARARDRKLVPDDLAGGTFTISNPGSVGAVSAPAIINQPQVAILGVPTIQRRPWVVTGPDGEEMIAIRSILRLAVTFDHRAVDGADATRFAVAVKSRLESWSTEAYA
ncbi:MAG TPA: dihydrolipoamide acetyltransferase family protein, partial [Solirubrobacterales bacterium]|nr:dihydrolipoamide acetyltransferase family protein [Solirubrobacterales bacterium]